MPTRAAPLGLPASRRACRAAGRALALVLVVLGLHSLSILAQDVAVPASLLNPQNAALRCKDKQLWGPAEMVQGCKEYLTYDAVYIDVLQPFRHLVASALTTSVIVADQQCLQAAYRFLCPLYYRPCEMVSVPGGFGVGQWLNQVPTARYVCGNLCEDYAAKCSRLADVLGVISPALFNCTKPYEPFFGVPRDDIYPSPPTYSVDISANGGNTYFEVDLPCYDDSKNITGSPELFCPDGLHYDGEFCSFDCPEPLIEDDEYDALTIMISVMAWLSVVLTAFLLVTYALDRSKIRFPVHLPVFFILCILLSAFGFCINSMVGHENVWCENEEEPNEFGNPACTIQGILYVYFTLAGVLWWFIIALNLFFTVVLNVQKWPTWLMVTYHTVAWGYPLLVLIVNLGTEHLGYGGSDLWCTIHSGTGVQFKPSFEGVTHEGGDPNLWNLLWLSVPILVVVVAGVIVLSIVLIVGYLKSHEGIRFFKSNWQLPAFLLMNVVIYTFVFVQQIHFESQRSSQYDAYDRYINCLFENEALIALIGLGTVEFRECDLDQEVLFGLWFVAAFGVAGQGVLVFLIFGISKRFYKGWVLLFKGRNPYSTTSGSASGQGTSSTFTSSVFTTTTTKVAAKKSSNNQSGTGKSSMQDEVDYDDEEDNDEIVDVDEDDTDTYDHDENAVELDDLEEDSERD